MTAIRSAAILGLVAMLAIAAPCGATTVYWTNINGGYWNVPSNWSPFMPGSSDSVMITNPVLTPVIHDSGTHTINSIYSLFPFWLTGGSLSLSNSSSILNGFIQTGGQLSGNGPTVIGGASGWTGGTISSLGGITNVGTWDFSGSTTRYLQGYITNNGTINQTGPLDISGGGNLYNASGKAYNLKCDNGVTSAAASGALRNAGTFNRTTTTGLADLACVFDNSGTANVSSGSIQFSGGGLSQSGTFRAEGGATGISFANGTYSLAGDVTMDGLGTISLKSGTMSMYQGSRLVCDAVGGFKILGGTISGLGIIRNTENCEWSAGSMVGMAGFENEKNMTITGSAFKYLQNTPFGNESYITHTGSGSIVFSQSGRLANLPSTTYELQSNAHFLDLDGTGRFDNGGTFRKSYSYGTTYIDPFVNSSGTFDIDSGVVLLRGGGQFVNGSAMVDHSATFGTYSGAYTVYGEFQCTGGGAASLGGGTLTLTEGATARFNLEEGVSLNSTNVSGHGNLITAGNADWSGSTISGTTHFINEGAMYITTNPLLTNAEFYNAGTTIQTASSGLRMANSAILTNQSTGEFEFRSDSGISGSGTITNGGVFSKIWASGTSVIQPVFNNTFGHFAIEQGTIKLSGGGSFTDGGAQINHPGVLTIDAGTYASSGQPTFSGDGNLNLSGATHNLALGAQVHYNLDGQTTLSAGTISGQGSVINGRNMTWSGGTIGTSTHLLNEGTLTISGSSQKLLQNAEFHNTKDTIQTGTTGLQMSGTALLSCPTSSTYELRTDAGITGSGTINTSGIFRKIIATGTAVIEPSFNCTQAFLDIDAGSVRFTGGGSFDLSGVDIQYPGAVTYSSGSYAVTNETPFLGTGSAVLDGGVFSFSPGGRLRFGLDGGFHFASGTLAGQGAVLCYKDSDWTSGIIAEGAVLENHATLTVSGSGTKSLRGGSLSTFATVNHLGTAVVEVREGSQITTAGGLYDLEGDGYITGAGLIQNDSYLRKTGGTTYSRVEPTLNNRGELEVSAGALVLAGPITQLVEGTLTGGTWIVRDGCELVMGERPINTNAASVTLYGDAVLREMDGLTTNSGTLRLLYGRGLRPADAFTNSGTLELGGGEFASGKNLNTGTWHGWGAITGSITNRALFRPEAAPKPMAVTGSYTQTSTGTLEVTLGGRELSQFGRLEVGGRAALNGVLKVNFGLGYTPRAGDTFEVLTCGTRTGTFSSIQTPFLRGGLSVNVIYTPRGVVLSVGDYLPPATEMPSCAATRQQASGSWLNVSAIVSASFSDCFFIQDANRVAGVRVTGLQTKPTVGKRVQVVGQIDPNYPCLTLKLAQWAIYPDAAQPPKPILMPTKNLGGAPLGLQGGVYGGVGLNNVGLLVRVTGKLRYLDPGVMAYIDDGSGLNDGNTLGVGGVMIPGLRVILAPGVTIPITQYASVTGVSYRVNIGAKDQRAVWVRTQADVSAY